MVESDFKNNAVLNHHFGHSFSECWLYLWQNSRTRQNIQVLPYKAEKLHVGNQYLELMHSFYTRCKNDNFYVLFKNLVRRNQLLFAKHSEFNSLTTQFH